MGMAGNQKVSKTRKNMVSTAKAARAYAKSKRPSLSLFEEKEPKKVLYDLPPAAHHSQAVVEETKEGVSLVTETTSTTLNEGPAPAHYSQTQNKETIYEYKAPESYKAPEVVEEPKEEEVIVEEVVAVTEEVIKEDVISPMEALADKVASLSPQRKSEKELREEIEMLNEQKINLLEKQIAGLTRQLNSMNSTIVHGIGLGSPGSGEVNLNRLDDVASSTLEDGDHLVWDVTLGRWIPSTAAGGEDIVTVTNRIKAVEAKILSVDDRMDTILKSDMFLLQLEEGTDMDGALHIGGQEEPEFFDRIDDGDTTTFAVGIDEGRGVYTLDGLPQPTVQLPRGDILVFDLSAMTTEQQDEFDIYINGVILPDGPGCERTQTSITVRTGQIDPSLTKLYYRNTNTRSMGWIIAISDN